MLDGQLQSDLFNKLKESKEGDVFIYDLPNQLGHYLIKLKEKTAPVEKFQLATIVMGVRASDNTVNQIRDKAKVRRFCVSESADTIRLTIISHTNV